MTRPVEGITAWAYAEIHEAGSLKTWKPISSRKAGRRMTWPAWSNGAAKTRGNGDR